MKLKGSTILENLIASVILMIIFVIAGNALNTSLKSRLNGRDIIFQNRAAKTEYLILNGKLELPQLIQEKNFETQFIQKGLKVIKIQDSRKIKTDTICCIKEE
jgi:hypothetical protein